MKELLARRYGPMAPDLTLPDSLLPLVSHRSVRAYEDRAVPQEVLEAAVVAAQSAANSSNLQAWSVVAVRDRARIDALNALSGEQKQIATAPLFLVWVADLSRLRAVAVEEGQAGEGLDHLEFVLMSTLDVGLAAQNATLAFEAMGLGCCYIGGIRNHIDQVAEILGLPPEAYPVVGMTVGYPDPQRPAAIRPRLPISAVLHEEGFKGAPLEEAQSYNAVLGAFQSEQGMKHQDWTAQTATRVSDLSYLSGREHLVAHLKTLGFGLK